MFADRTATFRQTYATPQDHSILRAQLYDRKAKLVREGEGLIASAGPHGELAQITTRLAEVEHEREQLKRSYLSGTAGTGLSIPSDSMRLPLGLIGLTPVNQIHDNARQQIWRPCLRLNSKLQYLSVFPITSFAPNIINKRKIH